MEGLRIGSLVYSHDSGIEETIKVLSQEGISYYGIDNILPFEMFEPIPLTEEWLLKMPKVKKIETFNIGNASLLDLGRNRRLSISLEQGNQFIWIQEYDKTDYRKVNDLVCLFNQDYDGVLYLHYFQNLVHLLTQTELEINP